MVSEKEKRQRQRINENEQLLPVFNLNKDGISQFDWKSKVIIDLLFTSKSSQYQWAKKRGEKRSKAKEGRKMNIKKEIKKTNALFALLSFSLVLSFSLCIVLLSFIIMIIIFIMVIMTIVVMLRVIVCESERIFVSFLFDWFWTWPIGRYSIVEANRW